jgi:hypothetical protein
MALQMGVGGTRALAHLYNLKHQDLLLEILASSASACRSEAPRRRRGLSRRQAQAAPAIFPKKHGRYRWIWMWKPLET